MAYTRKHRSRKHHGKKAGGNPKKGQKSKTRKGRKDFTTKKTSKYFNRKGHRQSRSAKGIKRRPYRGGTANSSIIPYSLKTIDQDKDNDAKLEAALQQDRGAIDKLDERLKRNRSKIDRDYYSMNRHYVQLQVNPKEIDLLKERAKKGNKKAEEILSNMRKAPSVIKELNQKLIPLEKLEHRLDDEQQQAAAFAKSLKKDDSMKKAPGTDKNIINSIENEVESAGKAEYLWSGEYIGGPYFPKWLVGSYYAPSS